MSDATPKRDAGVDDFNAATWADLLRLFKPDGAAELVRVLAADLPRQQSRHADAARAQDLAALGRIAHGLHGTSLQLGASSLADLCAAVETATDPAQALPLAAQMIHRHAALVDRFCHAPGLSDGMPVAIAAESPACQPSSSSLRVLLVEDNPVNQKVALRLLEGLGCTVTLVDNGLAAVQAVERAAYDLVLMDVQMPVMDGLEATRLIRALPELARQPHIFAMTSSADDGERQECLDAGMERHLAKPIRKPHLEALLKEVSDDLLAGHRPASQR